MLKKRIVVVDGLGLALFCVADGVFSMCLLRDKFSNDEFIEKHMPSLEKLDILSYRAISLGFLLLTLVIITGAIWAESA